MDKIHNRLPKGIRILFILSYLLISTPELAISDNTMKTYELWYDRPAFNRGACYINGKQSNFPYDEDWERWSLPIGNGYMGAAVFGRTDTERIQISEKTLANRGCYGKGGFTNFAEVFIDFHHYNTKNYRRSLSLNEAVSSVSYEHGGVKYRREYIANYPSNVIAMKISADKPGCVSFTLRPTIPYINTDRAGDRRTGKVTAKGSLITLEGKMEFFSVYYEAQFKVINYGGKLSAQNDAEGDNGRISVNKADSVVILVAAGTSYQLNENVFLLSEKDKCKGNQHPHNTISARIEAAVKKGYEKLRNEHVADYCRFFNRVNIKLTDRIPSIPTDVLLSNYKKGKYDTYLEELFFQYGRYLLISSSREGSLPANLQGTWTQYDYTPWSGGYWHNINVQMNYWPAFNTNLAEMFVPFVKYSEAYRKAAEENATNYVRRNNPDALCNEKGGNGWTIGTGATAYNVGSPGSHSGPGTGGFTTKLFWDYYDFTRDKNLLERHVYPALEGMAMFLSKTLKPDEEGHLLADPSFSPENGNNGKAYQTKGCTFDQGMIWENFSDLLNAAAILNKKSPLLKTIEKQIKMLDPVHVGESGQLKEYREEKKYGDIGEPKHRHISHLCLLYPGTLINANTPEWMEAARVALKKRGNSAGGCVGWPLAHRMNTWARLKDGEEAYRCYQTLISKGVVENLWGICPPFQIDCNFGGTAGVAEMLLQSHEGHIDILPALPKAWKSGKYSGLVARGNFVVDVKWQKGKATEIRINSHNGGTCRLKYHGISNCILKDTKGKSVRFKPIDNDIIEFKAKNRNTYLIYL